MYVHAANRIAGFITSSSFSSPLPLLQAAQGQIDLRIVMSFNLVDKKDKGEGAATKLELVLADKVIKLKCVIRRILALIF
jgi:hypothetical protein